MVSPVRPSLEPLPPQAVSPSAITTDMETYTEVEPVGENQLPGTYPMAVDEERSGELVYEVPSGFTDFSIAYLEQFVDDSGEESTGETFFVYFTAEDQTGASA